MYIIHPQTVLLLDAGPLSKLTNPRMTEENLQLNQWLDDLLAHNVLVIFPGITDYEVRRELLRADLTQALKKLDVLRMTLIYHPINTAVMDRAAFHWAEIRLQHLQTADDKALDGDVILIAHALGIRSPELDPVVVTNNKRHIERFLPAFDWHEIRLPDSNGEG